MRFVAAILSVLCLSASAAAAPAAAEQPAPRAGQVFDFHYERPRNVELLWIYDHFSQGSVQRVAESRNGGISLPRSIPVITKECGGARAFYDNKSRAITICYELFDSFIDAFSEILYPGQLQQTREMVQNVFSHCLDSILFVVLHEYGHALVHQLDLPVTGKEEDAADQLATILLLQAQNHGATMAASVAMLFSSIAARLSRDNKSMQHVPFWDEHSLDAQRMYDITCLIYGSNPQRFANLVGKEGLPTSRAARCQDEYLQKRSAWSRLLRPYATQSMSSNRE